MSIVNDQNDGLGFEIVSDEGVSSISLEENSEFLEMPDIVGVDSGSNKNSKSKNKSKIFKRKRKNDYKALPEDLKNMGFIEMDGNVPTNEFLILEEKSNIGKVILKILSIIFFVFLVCLSVAITYFCLSFKIIPESVRGSDLDVELKGKTYSIISKNHQPNLDELKIGDILVVVEEDSALPILLNYTELTFYSRNGVVLYCKDDKGADRKITTTEVKYVIPKGHNQ